MTDRQDHPLDRAVRHAEGYRIGVATRLAFPTLAGAFAVVIAEQTAPRSAPRDFFDIAAQVIVVLFLAAGLQTRLFTVRHHLPPLLRPTRGAPLETRARHLVSTVVTSGYLAFNGMMAAVVLIWGEAEALDALMGSQHYTNPRNVLASIFFAMVAIAVAALLPFDPGSTFPLADDETPRA
jgi:hypothetical protein